MDYRRFLIVTNVFADAQQVARRHPAAAEPKFMLRYFELPVPAHHNMIIDN
jgi:hypothetical protein